MVPPEKFNSVRSQSAMEYLMTYGWAILIIAVVLGILFQLGVFSSGSFAVRAPPGTCKVFRPAGSWTATNINLVGVCNGQLPQYAGKFGGSSWMSLVSSSMSYTKISVSAWIANFPTSGRFDMVNQYGLFFNVQTNKICFWINNINSAYLCSTATLPSGFVHVAATWDGSTETVYINGAPSGTLVLSGTGVSLSPSALGVCSYCGMASYFSGMISNIQIYNNSLSSGDVQDIYNKGIGGAPIQLQYLAGWWPLNGNSNDYSGNGNNGVPNSMAYTDQWVLSYSVH
jgi:hypothetical protein